VIEHVVLFAVEPDQRATLEEALTRFASDIRAAMTSEDLLELTWGPNVLPASIDRGYSHALLVRLAHPEALIRYQKSPIHQALLPTLDRTCSDRFAVDYEPRSSGVRPR
jgi:Stress responsive A/B Barrel Domain